MSILFTIIICVTVGSWNNYAKEKQFQKLMAARDERDVMVIRDGQDKAISVHDLLAGDILKINAGDQIPADCIILSGTKVSVDESSQTGETKDIKKQPIDSTSEEKPNPFLISGTMVKEGKGVAVVACVGDNTRMGRLREMLNQEEELTPLQRKLERIANGIGIMGMIAAGATAFFMAIWLIVSIVDGSIKQKAEEDQSEVISYGINKGIGIIAVSYTHLTLPTICSV
eukprot:TRINITY_DN5107_c0_g1_i5.p2 TRINITY_DN5107_c0_g1~~TRINITY_DN5107_c0_g1_i5.p2  ORF type:complete len:228 (-),score=71.62 TRINITY_DN5107_c0_g1_i5:79-762(-)